MKGLIDIFHCCKREEIVKSQKEGEVNVYNNNNVDKSVNIKNNKIVEASSNKKHSATFNVQNNIINQNIPEKRNIYDLSEEQIKEGSKVKTSSFQTNLNEYNESNNNNKKRSSLNNKIHSINEKVHGINSKDEPKKVSKIVNESIITLNSLHLNQLQEETITEMGSKLLLSGELFFWKDIIIETFGMKNSLRKEKDEHVFFGIKNKTNYSGMTYNDLIINFFWQNEDKEMIETNTGRVFEIFYNKKSKDYTLRFLHPNLILYYKINNFVYFNAGKDYFLLLGNVFVTINVKKVSAFEKIINILVEVENDKPINYSFKQNQVPIKVGRNNKNEIYIQSNSISKKHGIIEYSENVQTFYYKDMGSTNNSTLLIKEGDILKINGQMNFKLEDIPFRIQEIP